MNTDKDEQRSGDAKRGKSEASAEVWGLARQIWRQRRLLLGVAVVAVLWLIWRQLSSDAAEMGITKSAEINITPEQIERIREIGEWEFLAVSNEELIDTTRRGIFSDDHLSRIYVGTLRLGVDLSQTREGWLSAHGDTVKVLMPPIQLLDEDFIDETLTKPFFESGRWSAKDREAMYQRAKLKMKSHSLTPQNIETAQAVGQAQMRKLMTALGFSRVEVEFEQGE